MADSELATMEQSELEDRLTEARQELFNLRFQLATGQLDNSARLRHVRREVARILTYLRQHELAEDLELGGTTAAAAAAAVDEDEDEEA